MNENSILKWLFRGVATGFIASYTVLGIAFHIAISNPSLFIKQDADLVFSVTEEDVVRIIESSSEHITKAVLILGIILSGVILYLTHESAFNFKKGKKKDE